MNTQQNNQNNPIDTLRDLASLDSIAQYAIFSMAEECPNYFHEYEAALAKSIRNYGLNLVKECKDSGLRDLPDEAIEKVIENRIGDSDALDVAFVLNHEYFKSRVQFGALFMVQLLF